MGGLARSFPLGLPWAVSGLLLVRTVPAGEFPPRSGPWTAGLSGKASSAGCSCPLLCKSLTLLLPATWTQGGASPRSTGSTATAQVDSGSLSRSLGVSLVGLTTKLASWFPPVVAVPMWSRSLWWLRRASRFCAGCAAVAQVESGSLSCSVGLLLVGAAAALARWLSPAALAAMAVVGPISLAQSARAGMSAQDAGRGWTAPRGLLLALRVRFLSPASAP